MKAKLLYSYAVCLSQILGVGNFRVLGHQSLIALTANRVFFKTLPRSVKTSFMTKGHGQGVLKRKNY